MAVGSKKGVIEILTGGGDVPGFRPAIRGVTISSAAETLTQSTRLFRWRRAISLSIWLLSKIRGRLVVLKNGRYDNMPIEVVTATKTVVNINEEHYNTDRVRPHCKSFEMKPIFIMIMTSESA